MAPSQTIIYNKPWVGRGGGEVGGGISQPESGEQTPSHCLRGNVKLLFDKAGTGYPCWLRLPSHDALSSSLLSVYITVLLYYQCMIPTSHPPWSSCAFIIDASIGSISDNFIKFVNSSFQNHHKTNY